jgi:diguanylate cyclase (GGDEF)-like protein
VKTQHGCLSTIGELIAYIYMSASSEFRELESVFDPLTRLYNRRGFKQRLVEEYDRARNLRLPLSVLALDLDHFREVNRRASIPGGDLVLAEVARRVATAARPGDLVVRDGGDQFSVILPGTDGEEACREAERIRLAISSAPIKLATPYFSGEVPVAVSVGVATATFQESESWEVFVRARDAMHRAKDSGRDRVAD